MHVSTALRAPTDEELVARARIGDLGSFEGLVERHRDVVYRVAARIVGPDDASDVSQDAFLRAFHRLDQLSGELLPRLAAADHPQRRGLPRERRRPEPVDPAPAEDDERPDRVADARQSCSSSTSGCGGWKRRSGC